jgi:hypothetical protein
MFYNLHICRTTSDIYNTFCMYMSDNRQTLLNCKYIKISLQIIKWTFNLLHFVSFIDKIYKYFLTITKEAQKPKD